MLKNAIVVCGGVALGLVASKYLKPNRSPHTPIVLVVTVEIAKERLDAFRAAMEIDAAGSRLEPGCLRFDLLEDAENPLKFTFYEARETARARGEGSGEGRAETETEERRPRGFRSPAARGDPERARAFSVAARARPGVRRRGRDRLPQDAAALQGVGRLQGGGWRALADGREEQGRRLHGVSPVLSARDLLSGEVFQAGHASRHASVCGTARECRGGSPRESMHDRKDFRKVRDPRVCTRE